jgi:UDP-GlcNAc:undecaprenyl-phosphate/decaprenyl-phosphate GlcNAc-1-phosphate transferase
VSVAHEATAIFGCVVIATYVGTGVCIPLLGRWGVLDEPNARSLHTAATPRGGGLVAMTAIVISTTVWSLVNGNMVLLILALATGALGTVGFGDDVRGLGAIERLVIQLCVGGASAVSLVVLLGGVGWIVTPLLIVWLAGFTNMFNFMDGVNGISGLTALVAGSWYAGLGYVVDATAVSVVGLSVAGAALGFLPWNFPRARTFLGDVGSYSFGFALAACAALAWLSGAPALPSVAPLVIYLADTSFTIARRIKGREGLTTAHRGHVYQRLTSFGMTHSAVSAAVVVAALMCCLTAAVAWSNWLGYLAVGLFVAMYLGSPNVLARASTARARR